VLPSKAECGGRSGGELDSKRHEDAIQVKFFARKYFGVE
jgi:hypothetical protein